MKINIQAVRNTFSMAHEISALRYEKLHNEIFKDYAATDVPADSKDYHLVLYKNNEIAANIALSPVNKESICVKQIFVNDNIWHPGIEQQLINYAENWAKEIGFVEIKVNCSRTGIPFYSKLKYSSTDTVITDSGIQYHQLSKKLNQE